MASDNPTAAGGSSRRSRTPPTLDLKAEEVRTDTGSEPTASAPASGESTAVEGAKDTVTPPDDTAAKTSAPETPTSEASASGEPVAESTPTEARNPDAATADQPADAATGSDALPQPEAASEAPVAQPRRGGAGTVIAALLLGAVAGGAAGGGVLYYAMQHAPQPVTVDLSPLNARIATLEARPVADPAALAAVRQSLSRADARFTALDSALASLKAAPAATAPATAAPAPNVDALKASLSKTETALAEVTSRVSALKSSQDSLKAAQEGLQSAVASASSAAQQAQGAAQGLAPRIDGLNTRIDTVRKEAADAATAAAAINRGAAAVLVLGTLKQSVDAGRPFAPELEAARALLGPRAAPLEPFANMAQGGFPPLPKLAEQLLSAGNAAIDGLTPTPEAPPPDASLVTRFLSSAQSLVKVRPADSLDPESLRGVLNRAVAAVRMGDIESALATLKQLPPPVQQKLTAVVAELDARRRAGEAATSLYQQALAAISGKAP